MESDSIPTFQKRLRKIRGGLQLDPSPLTTSTKPHDVTPASMDEKELHTYREGTRDQFGNIARWEKSLNDTDPRLFAKPTNKIKLETVTFSPISQVPATNSTAAPVPGSEQEPIYISSSSEQENETPCETREPANNISHAHNLSSMGFTTISREEYENQKHKAALKLGPFLRPNTPKKETHTPRDYRIPKKSRSRHINNMSAPVPRRVPTHEDQHNVAKTAHHGPNTRREATRRASLTRKQLRKIVRQRERELAHAVMAERHNLSSDERMQQRIYTHRQPTQQKYYRRLRKAVYFEDSSEDDMPAARYPIGLARMSGSSDEQEIWENEPPRPREQDKLDRMQNMIEQTQQENRQLRQQMAELMRTLQRTDSYPK